MDETSHDECGHQKFGFQIPSGSLLSWRVNGDFGFGECRPEQEAERVAGRIRKRAYAIGEAVADLLQHGSRGGRVSGKRIQRRDRDRGGDRSRAGERGRLSRASIRTGGRVENLAADPGGRLGGRTGQVPRRRGRLGQGHVERSRVGDGFRVVTGIDVRDMQHGRWAVPRRSVHGTIQQW